MIKSALLNERILQPLASPYKHKSSVNCTALLPMTDARQRLGFLSSSITVAYIWPGSTSPLQLTHIWIMHVPRPTDLRYCKYKPLKRQADEKVQSILRDHLSDHWFLRNWWSSCDLIAALACLVATRQVFQVVRTASFPSSTYLLNRDQQALGRLGRGE